MQIGRERVTQSANPDEIAALRAKAPDCKETMEIGRDWDATWKNMWPRESDVPGFKQTMLDFFYVRAVIGCWHYQADRRTLLRPAISFTLG